VSDYISSGTADTSKTSGEILKEIV
jgi:hypothetical protein